MQHTSFPDLVPAARTKPVLAAARATSNVKIKSVNPHALLQFATETCKMQFSMCSTKRVDLDAISSNIRTLVASYYGPGYIVYFTDAEEGGEVEGEHSIDTLNALVINVDWGTYHSEEIH